MFVRFNNIYNSLDRLWSNQDLLYNYRGVIEKKDNIFSLFAAGR